MKFTLGISNFFEKISSLSHSIIFPISLHWSLKKAFLSLLSILWNYASKWVYLSFSPLPLAPLLFSAICSWDNYSTPQTTILPFCISFSWGWFWSLPPVQCHKPLSTVLQALCLSRKSVLNTHWKDWCWSWSSNTLATWCKELTP